MSATDALASVLPREKAAAFLTYVSACVVNFFVPSGGGQWALQGPIIAETARAIGMAPGPLVLAMAYGDQCTNLLQPFWALPLARDHAAPSGGSFRMVRDPLRRDVRALRGFRARVMPE